MFRGVKRESFARYTKRRGSKTDDLQSQWEMKAQVCKMCLLLSFTEGDIMVILFKQIQNIIPYGDGFDWVLALFQTLTQTNISLI